MGNKHIVLLACSKTKLPHRAKAKDLYQGTIFKKSLRFAEKLVQNPRDIYILSAKHRLLKLDKEIEPYDQSIYQIPASERRAWGKLVLDRLTLVADLERDFFTILAPEKYRRYLLEGIRNYEIPLEGLTQGKQMQFLNKALDEC